MYNQFTKIIFLLATSLISLLCIADEGKFNQNLIKLRNGGKASQHRVDQVWDALTQVDPYTYHAVFKACKRCKEQDLASCDLKSLDQSAVHFFGPDTIEHLARLEILSGSVIDRQTQDIIISSFKNALFKGNVPIVLAARYPVVSFKERIPLYDTVSFLYGWDTRHIGSALSFYNHRR